LDDVHEIGERSQTQEELFNLFNLFVGAERQMVFTAKVLPQEMEGLDDRLRSRLVGGLVAMITPPDAELRRTIVRSHLEARVGSAEADVVDYLAERATESVRSLLHMVQRVVTGAEAMGRKPDVESARQLLEEARKPEPHASLSGRVSGGMAAPPGALRSEEKIVWHWPNMVERVIEELS
jgi:chromosomal replication initiator protein